MNDLRIQVAARSGAVAILRWCPLWPALLLLSLLFPTEFSFSLGPLRLTPYRLILLAGFFPALVRLVSGRAGRMSMIDLLIFFNGIWAWIVFDHHHGFSAALESGGVRILELCGGYLIARAWVVDEKSFRGVVAFMVAIICVLAPITAMESLTGFHALKILAAKLSGHPFVNQIDTRMGLHRAYGPFDHPILYGVFAASLVGMAWLRALPRLGYPRPPKWPRQAIVIGAISSVSSGALASMMTQFSLIIWDRWTGVAKNKWLRLFGLFMLGYGIVGAFSTRSAYMVLLSYLTFSPGTAYNRVVIFEWGIQDVWRNPLFGIGFNEWTRPEWMHSTSMDNFWLVQAVTFGLPGFLSLAMAISLALGQQWDNLPPRLAALRKGWGFSMFGTMIAACTVHFWNGLFVHFAFLLGMGIWFLKVRRQLYSSDAESYYGY